MLVGIQHKLCRPSGKPPCTPVWPNQADLEPCSTCTHSFGRDRRTIGKEAAEATRKSVRIRAVPEVLAPPAVPGVARGRGKRPPPCPEDATDVNLGREFQATLPAVRPRPAAPSAEEQRFVSRLVCAAGDVPPPQYDPEQTAALPAASEADRWVLVCSTSLS